jgi:ATP-dependent DNA ligase
MTLSSTLRQVAAEWQLQWPGRRHARDIADAIVEPYWGGARVVAALTAEDAAIYREGAELTVPAELIEGLLHGFTAIEAVIEGHLTTAAFRTGEGAVPKMPTIERPSLLLPRSMRRRLSDDPAARIRAHDERMAQEESTVKALAEGTRHAFVATDLLMLDGQSLAGVPLLERKRLLETVLDESNLIRVSAFVRPTAVVMLVSWAALGFADLSYRGTNSRYLAGQENPDWAIAKAPQTPHPVGAPGP